MHRSCNSCPQVNSCPKDNPCAAGAIHPQGGGTVFPFRCYGGRMRSAPACLPKLQGKIVSSRTAAAFPDGRMRSSPAVTYTPCVQQCVNCGNCGIDTIKNTNIIQNTQIPQNTHTDIMCYSVFLTRMIPRFAFSSVAFSRFAFVGKITVTPCFLSSPSVSRGRLAWDEFNISSAWRICVRLPDHGCSLDTFVPYKNGTANRMCHPEERTKRCHSEERSDEES